VKLIPLVFRTLLLAGLALSCGCNTRARFEEVSSAPAYSRYIGEEYVLKVPMHISGVNLPPGYRKIIDIYVVNPTSPSWTGPELVTRETLPPGTVITVESVHRCTNCFLDFKDRLEAHLHIPGFGKTADRPVKISLEHLEPPFAERQAKKTLTRRP
jgi:hypothetical protein